MKLAPGATWSGSKDVSRILNLEPTPNAMPVTGGWLVDSKEKLRKHFQCSR